MITVTQGVDVTSSCASCGGVLVREVGQFIDRGQLRWGVEGRCLACQDGWCDRGAGSAPEEIRQALLARHGATRIRLAPGEASLVPVMRALREVGHLSLREARLAAADLQGAGLVGTKVGMAHLAEALHRRSVATTLAPATD